MSLLVFGLAACGGEASEGSRDGTTTETTETTETQEPERSAAEFLVAVNRQLLDGEAEEAYETLHRRHQQAVGQERFVECYRRLADEIPATSIAIEAVSTREDVPLPPGFAAEEATEVTIRYSGPFDFVSERQAFRAVVEDGQWRWLLPNYVHEDFERGVCPRF